MRREERLSIHFFLHLHNDHFHLILLLLLSFYLILFLVLFMMQAFVENCFVAFILLMEGHFSLLINFVTFEFFIILGKIVIEM